jgi:tetratricopeptide (TPR) repeat protein
MKARSLHWLAIALALAIGAKAQAAVTVVGPTLAVQCYKRAQAGGTKTDVCDDALKEDLLDRDRASTLVNRGIIYNNVRKVDLALADFAAALAIDPNIAEAYLSRGNSRFYQKRFKDAVADYTRAIDLNIDRLAAAYYNRALAYANLEEYGKTRADLVAATKADPSFKLAQQQLAALDRFLAKRGSTPLEPSEPQ